MKSEKQTFEHLIEFLRKHGFPETSFASEFKFIDRHVDLAILNPVLSIPLMFFKFKPNKTNELVELDEESRSNQLKKLFNSTIPTFLVYSESFEPFFSIHQVFFDSPEDRFRTECIPSRSILYYSYLRRSRLIEESRKPAEKKEKTMDHFRILCWITSIALLIIAILIKLSILSTTSTGLALLCGGFTLLILPFASKLKILGVEFERYEKAKEQKNESS